MGVIDALQQKEFDLARASLSMPEKTGGDHLGVIDDEDVARFQVVDHVVKMLIGKFSRLAVDHQQTGRITRLRGVLRDEFFG